MPDNSIYTTLSRYLSGSTLTLSPAVFGAGNITDVLTEYFPADSTLVIDAVTLVQQGDDVVFTAATGVTAPLGGLTIDASFSPGTDGVSMTLVATLPASWVFSRSWPLLAGGPTDQLAVSGGTLTLASDAVTPTLAKGLNFSGGLATPGTWSTALWLLGGASTLPVQGPIGQQGTAPAFAFTATIGAVELPVLGPLTVDFVLSSTPISGAVKPPGSTAFAFAALPAPAAASGPVASPYVPCTAIGVATSIQIAGTPVPIFVDLSLPGGTLAITADVSQLSLVALSDLTAIVANNDLSSALPPSSLFDPGEHFTLETLSFTLAPAARQLVSVALTLGTHKAWPISSGLSAGPITFQFVVGIAQSLVTASLTGAINFPGGSFGLGAYYPGFVFAGGLTPGSTINLSDVISSVLGSTPINATLLLDQLDFVVSPTSGGSFSLTTGLTGNWSLPVGVATLELTGAYLQLDRQSGGSSGAGTSGAISMMGKLVPPSGAGDPVTFAGTWSIPGSFALTAQFPDIDLTALAAKLAGTAPPDGVPAIALVDGQLGIVLDVSSGDYNFALATGASIGGTSIGSAIFAARRTTTAFGFLIGIVITEGWSPAEIWPDLATLFGGLTFSRSGLVISTLPAGTQINLPNMTMPSLPASAAPGFTFFSTLALQGAILGPLAALFENGVTFDLLAVVNTTNPVSSEFQAVFSGSSANNQIAWTGVTVTLIPATTTFSVQAGAVFTIHSEQVTIAGTGTVQLEPAPSVTLSLLVESWPNPFGITNLTIKEFGLQVGYKDGAALTIGLLGAFVIGSAARCFTLVIGGEIIDFEAPGALIFQLDDDNPANPLMLSDVIQQFTSLDLSSVPVLDQIGFTDLDFAVVDDPAGFTIGDYHFPPGIGIQADIFIYSWEAEFDFEVNFGTGIKASGSINKPIELGGVFTLSDVTGLLGPSGSIDTSQIMSRPQRRRLAAPRTSRALPAGSSPQTPYISLDGRLQFLGIDESIQAQASGTTFDFAVSFAFLDIVQANLACQLIDAKNFSAAASIGFDLDVTVGPYAVDGITLIPKVHIDGPAASLALAIAINPTVIAQLSLALQFTWQSLDTSVAFTLGVDDIARDLTQLYQALVSWLENHVDQLFADLLDDVDKWVDAVKRIFTDLAADIDNVANALANYFNTAADDAAAFLRDLGFGFEAIVDALVKYFKIAYDDAVTIVEGLWGDCGMESAEDQAYAGRANLARRYTVRDLAFVLTSSPGGQRLLEMYYSHDDELHRLLARHPYLHRRWRSFAVSYQAARDPRLLVETTVKALVKVAPRASPALRARIDEVLPELMRFRTMTHRDILETLNR